MWIMNEKKHEESTSEREKKVQKDGKNSENSSVPLSIRIQAVLFR